MTPHDDPRTVHVTALGCAKNRVDAEVMGGRLVRAGASLVDDPQRADVLLVHTCSFIADATQESIDTILALAQHRVDGTPQRLVVTGCLSQRYGTELPALLPEVDVFAGTGALDEVVELCLGEPGSAPRLPAPERAGLDGRARTALALGPSAYVKVGEGCSQRCAFCIIPALRGPLRSRPLGSIVDEVAALVDAGVREINLLGQDTTSYGLDLPGRTRLPELLEAVDRVDGVRWIRLLYAYPARFTDRLIETIAGCERVCAYVDVPLQHVDDGVLRVMRRGTSERTVRRLVERLRSGIDGVALRTTMLVGHPGETDAAFDRLLEFVAQARFERLGAFAYSPEEGTASATMAGAVDEAEGQRRLDALMTLQADIHEQHNRALLGQRREVLVEGWEEGPLLVGRTAQQAPEVDGGVIIDATATTPDRVGPGDLVQARVTGVDGYDLVAALEPAEAPPG